MFVIKNKLSLLDRMSKSMHYPESPKVSSWTPSVQENIPLAGPVKNLVELSVLLS